MKQIILGLLLSNILVSQCNTDVLAQTPPLEMPCLPEQKLVVKLDSNTIVCRKTLLPKNEIEVIDEVTFYKKNSQGLVTVFITVLVHNSNVRLIVISEKPNFTQTAFLTVKRKFYSWAFGQKDINLVNKYHSDISRVLDVLEVYPREKVIENF